MLDVTKAGPRIGWCTGFDPAMKVKLGLSSTTVQYRWDSQMPLLSPNIYV